MSTSGIHSKV